MPKIHDTRTPAGKRPLIEPTAKSGRPGQEALKGIGYYEGVAALGLEPQAVGPDLQMLGIDPATMTEDFAAIFQDLQPAYDYYLRAEQASKAVGHAYKGEPGGRSNADGRFTITLNELVLRVVDLAKTQEFAKNSNLTARMKMTKENKRKMAERAQKLLDELQHLVAAMALMAARVQHSGESSLNMELGMARIVEVRSLVQWQQRTFRSEGLEVGGGQPAKKPEPGPPA